MSGSEALRLACSFALVWFDCLRQIPRSHAGLKFSVAMMTLNS